MRKIRKYFAIGIFFFSFLILNFNAPAVGIEPKSSRDEYWPLVVGTTNLGNDLDPANAWDSYSFDIISQVWEGLYANDIGNEPMGIIPRLATNNGIWNSAGDVFNVTLRSGVSFHNGQTFDASTVKYTFDRLWNLCVYHDTQIRDLYFPFGFNTPEMNETIGYGYIINETIVVDATHVSFKLNFPYVPFKSLLSFSGSSIVEPSTTDIDTFINFDDVSLGRAIGTGPYKIVEYYPDDYINFVSYDTYYRGIPAIKNIRFEKYSNSADISQALLDGYIDFPRSIDNNRRNDFQENLMTLVEEPNELSLFYYLGMNNDEIAKEYRQAINYAIDYEYILNDIYDNTLIQMTSIIPRNIIYHKDCNVPYWDLWYARQILIDAGLSGTLNYGSTDQEWINVANSGSPLLSLYYQFNEVNKLWEEIGLLLIDNLEKIGIKVYLEPLPWTELMNKLTNYPEELDLFTLGWMADFNDPSNFINSLLSNTSKHNAAQVNDPWLQSKMSEGLVEINDLNREVIYYQIQDYIATVLMPFVFLGYKMNTGVHTAHLENFQYNSMRITSYFECSWADDESDIGDGDGIPDFYEFYQYGTDPYNWDSDYDNIGDWDEIFMYYTNPNEWDSDHDSLGDWDEIFNIGTNPTDWDTDDDDLGDGDELSFGTDPFIWDSDGDGLSDGEEVLSYHTDPNYWDTDYDDYSDKDEIDAGSDPLDSESTPENVGDSGTDPFANIPGYPVTYLLSVCIVLSIGLIFFTKKLIKS
ncbi:ABC transporter substrate-binding protein [Promethearchaeum syntrophicum]|uniref:ABC transporter substrate-binding protein n=1 Tax=Promethearchaeum syntrophicum TaxID=2594042 RepID=A0A5B9D6B4_9ARCH|nr:ABC transporter substrate-binding protein [Candidatus Prometheoarchaeum syntrophicum]QEE14545.1 Bacterial extracellular solute-binding proteins, family 5 Middle [Candidatus Prometheoarchaeum syntrophicum]